MKLEIWSDYACPYCYIGKRFLEAALAEFEHAREIEIVFRAFELDPTSGPAVTTTTLDRIMRKYGKSRSDAQAMIDHITSMGERCGLDMRYASVRYTNTFDAHRLRISPSYPSPTFLNEPMIIVLSPGLYRAATIVASMAIVSPETTGGAPACRPEQRGGRRSGTLLPREE